MGTVFVAYGQPGTRIAVLEFAAKQAAASGHDLLVYHVQESPEASAREIREEVEAVTERAAPDTPVEIRINERDEVSDRTNVSVQKRLVDAILDSDREYEYVVMGHIERGSVDGFTHASVTRAVLEAHTVPVVLVPV